MITAIVQKDHNGVYRGFSISGHAMYDDYGKDIVCASVSILSVNTVNSIESLTDCKFQVEEHDGISFRFTTEPDEKGKLLMDSFVLGLKGINGNYPKYLRLKFEEV